MPNWLLVALTAKDIYICLHACSSTIHESRKGTPEYTIQKSHHLNTMFGVVGLHNGKVLWNTGG